MLDTVESARLMNEITDKGYAFNGKYKYYKTINNLVKINTNPFPIEISEDEFYCRASDLGPGAEWYKLQERFPDSTGIYLFEDDMESVPAQGKKENIWFLNSEEIFDAEETILAQKFIVGIREQIPGYIMEALDEGLDLYAFWNENLNRLLPDEKDFFFGLLQLKEDDELDRDNVIATLKVAFGINEEIDEQSVVSTIEPIVSEKISKPENSTEALVEYFNKGDIESLSKLLSEKEISFTPLLPLIYGEAPINSELDINLIDKIKSRIAIEFSLDEKLVATIQRELDDSVYKNHKHLDLFVRMSSLDFTKVRKNLDNIPDKNLVEVVEKRIDNDWMFQHRLITSNQFDLDLAIRSFEKLNRDSDLDTILESVKYPMLDFSELKPSLLEDRIPYAELESIKVRVEEDKLKTKELARFMSEELVLDFVNGEFIDLKEYVNLIPTSKSVSQERDIDNEIDQSEQRSKGNSLGL